MGNPGEPYRKTRHNLGFRLVDRLRERWSLAERGETCGSRIWADSGTVLARPETFMNRSGWAVECLVDLFEVEPERVLVAFDDVALPLGSIRIRPQGGAGGHRGLESVLSGLRSDAVPRLRLGIAPNEGLDPAGDLSEFVLAPFGTHEEGSVEAMLDRAVEAVELWRRDGIVEAMNRFNA